MVGEVTTLRDQDRQLVELKTTTGVKEYPGVLRYPFVGIINGS